MSERPKQHFQHEFDADKPAAGLLPDAILFKWFNGEFSTSKHLLTLYTLVRGLNAKHVLEVGFGRSSIVLARAVAENGGEFVCCDSRDFSYSFNSEELKTVRFVNGFSSEARKQFEKSGLDFAFLDYFSDASISEEFVRTEVLATLTLLKQNGIICIHDALVEKYNVGKVIEKMKKGRFGFHNSDVEIISLPFNYGLTLIRRTAASPFGTLPDIHLKKAE